MLGTPPLAPVLTLTHLHSGWELIPRFVSFCFHCSGVALSVPTFTDLFHYDLNDLRVFILLYFPDCLVRAALCFSSAKGWIASQWSDKVDRGLENGMPPGQGQVPLSAGAPAIGKEASKS